MKTNKEISKKREKAIGEQIGGRSHLNSGALWFQKGDVSNDFIIIEDKFTKQSSFSLTTSIINKIEKEGKHEQKVPVISICFFNENFSVGIVESSYCKHYASTLIVDSIQAANKSVLLKYLPIHETWLKQEELCAFRIDFVSLNKIFYLFEWNSLIENINSLLYL